MAEFLGQKKPKRIDFGPDQGFNAMGKSIPTNRRLVADEHLKDMGIESSEDRFTCIQRICGRLERDDPYGAQSEAMKFVDLTGSYRLMAALLTGGKDGNVAVQRDEEQSATAGSRSKKVQDPKNDSGRRLRRRDRPL